jgi:hypothetical protein
MVSQRDRHGCAHVWWQILAKTWPIVTFNTYIDLEMNAESENVKHMQVDWRSATVQLAEVRILTKSAQVSVQIRPKITLRKWANLFPRNLR